MLLFELLGEGEDTLSPGGLVELTDEGLKVILHVGVSAGKREGEEPEVFVAGEAFEGAPKLAARKVSVLVVL